MFRTVSGFVSGKASRRITPVWLPVSVVALLLRLPVFFLPAPGRDEAAYYYWSRHAEPAYAPLIQWLIRLTTLLPLPEVLALRTGFLITGIGVLVLFDRLLSEAGATPPVRLVALAALAFSPWQTYTGALAHPDTPFLAAVLLFVITFRNNKKALAAFFAGVAVLSKPTGVAILAVALLCFALDTRLRPVRRLAYSSLALIVASPVLLSFSGQMLAAISNFGKISADVSLPARMAITAVSIFGLGGLLLPWAAMRGFMERMKDIRRAPSSRQRWLLLKDPAFAVAMVLVLGFLSAAIFRGQIKGNWLLPGFVLLWPVSRISLRPGYRVAVVVSFLLSAMMVIAMRSPGSVALLENRVQFMQSLYQQQAGAREARVSRTRTWSQRLQEYQPMAGFAASVATCWCRTTGEQGAPKWIISDDYGLAAQLAFSWRNFSPRIIIPDDGIFFRTVPDDSCTTLRGGVLLMAVKTTCDRLWQRLPGHLREETVHHPQAGISVSIAGKENIPLLLPGAKRSRGVLLTN